MTTLPRDGWGVTIKGGTGPGEKKKNILTQLLYKHLVLSLRYLLCSIVKVARLATSTNRDPMPRSGSHTGPLGVTCCVSTNHNHWASRV